MKIPIALILFCLASLNILAFEKPLNIKPGVFGVCNCQAGAAKTNIIELSLNSDSTFNYMDNSDPSNKLSYTGKWIARNNKLYLVTSDNKKSFHRKWKFDSNGKCIKSRYKLNFRRICLMTS